MGRSTGSSALIAIWAGLVLPPLLLRIWRKVSFLDGFLLGGIGSFGDLNPF